MSAMTSTGLRKYAAQSLSGEERPPHNKPLLSHRDPQFERQIEEGVPHPPAKRLPDYGENSAEHPGPRFAPRLLQLIIQQEIGDASLQACKDATLKPRQSVRTEINPRPLLERGRLGQTALSQFGPDRYA